MQSPADLTAQWLKCKNFFQRRNKHDKHSPCLAASVQVRAWARRGVRDARLWGHFKSDKQVFEHNLRAARLNRAPARRFDRVINRCATSGIVGYQLRAAVGRILLVRKLSGAQNPRNSAHATIAKLMIFLYWGYAFYASTSRFQLVYVHFDHQFVFVS